MKLILKDKKQQIVYDLKKILKEDYNNKSHKVSFSLDINENVSYIDHLKIITDDLNIGEKVNEKNAR